MSAGAGGVVAVIVRVLGRGEVGYFSIPSRQKKVLPGSRSYLGMKIINIVASGDLHQPIPFERLPELSSLPISMTLRSTTGPTSSSPGEGQPSTGAGSTSSTALRPLTMLISPIRSSSP